MKLHQFESLGNLLLCACFILFFGRMLFLKIQNKEEYDRMIYFLIVKPMKSKFYNYLFIAGAILAGLYGLKYIQDILKP